MPTARKYCPTVSIPGVAVMLFFLLNCPMIWSATKAADLDAYSTDSIRDADRARVALAATEQARRDYLERWQIQNHECLRRIAVNRCRASLKLERQKFETKATAIEIHSRQVIRNTILTERNSSEIRSGTPQAPGQAESSTENNPDQRKLRLEQQETRLAQHEANLAARKEQGLAEANKRQQRIAALEQRRRENRQKLEQGRKKALEKQAAQKQAAQQAASKKPPTTKRNGAIEQGEKLQQSDKTTSPLAPPAKEP